MAGFLDLQTPASPGIGGLLGADFQRQAAMQNLIGTLIGFGQGPSPVPLGFGTRMAMAAKQGQQSQRDYETDALKQALGVGQIAKFQADATVAQQKAEAAKRQQELLAPLMARLIGGGQAGSAGMTGAPGVPGAGGAAAAPAGPMSGDPLFNNSPQSNAVLSLLGMEPSKIHQNPFLRDNIDETGQKRTERWNPASQSWIREGSPEAQPGFAYLPDGGQAPIAGGPADPRYKGTVAATTAQAEMPFKPPVVIPEGGMMAGPSLWGALGGGRSPQAAAGGGGMGVGRVPMAAAGAAPGQPQQMPGGGNAPQIVQTPAGPVLLGPTKPIASSTKAEVEKGMVADSDILSQLNLIKSRFKPEFQTVGTRLGMDWSALKEKVNPALLSPQDKAALSEFSQYKAEAAQMFSTVLKSLSGAAVTPAEMKRAESWIPNPGSGWFDGDSPTQLSANIDRLQNFTQMALAKKSYITERGLSVNEVSIDQMPTIMNNAGKAFMKQFIDDGMDEQQARNAAARAVAMKFGLLARQ